MSMVLKAMSYHPVLFATVLNTYVRAFYAMQTLPLSRLTLVCWRFMMRMALEILASVGTGISFFSGRVDSSDKHILAK